MNFDCEGEIVCQSAKYFAISVFKNLLFKRNLLVFKTCLVLINKAIKLKVINTVINFQ